MKKTILGLIGVLVTFCAAEVFADVTPESVPVEKFRSELQTKMNNLGVALSGLFSPNLKAMSEGLRDIMRTDDYRVCTDSTNDNTTDDKKKAQQISACQKVGELAQALSKRVGALENKRVAKLKLDENEKNLDAFTDSQTRPDRKNFSVNAKNALSDSFNAQYGAMNEASKKQNERVNDQCYNLPMSKSVTCAMDTTIAFLEKEFPTLLNSVRDQFSKDLVQLSDTIASYQDEPILTLK